MCKFNINKVKVIIDVIKEHLENSDEYRFACDLTESERVFIERHFNVEEIEDFETTKLYKLTKK